MNNLNILRKNGCDIYEKTDPETFADKFSEAAKHNKNAECVDIHSAEEYSKMTCLTSKNGFVAVEKSGNINSVLRDESVNEYTKPFLKGLMANAMVHGGNKLDCFAITHKDINGNVKDAGLADMYAKLGFIPVCRDKFNEGFAPDNWDYEKNGKPDIVFMYNIDSVEKMLEKSNDKKYSSYLTYLNKGEVPYIQDLPNYDPAQSSYEQALAYRDQIMKEAEEQFGKAVQQSNVENISKVSENELVDENTDDITKK